MLDLGLQQILVKSSLLDVMLEAFAVFDWASRVIQHITYSTWFLLGQMVLLFSKEVIASNYTAVAENSLKKPAKVSWTPNGKIC